MSGGDFFMLPTRLELHNFLAYRSPDPIVFEGIHLACLSGANGAGKSSLLDAITWALWGKARTRSDDDLIYQGQADMVVQLDFTQDKNRYRVVRKRQKGKTAKSGRSALDLFMWDIDDEQWQSISAPSIRETDKRIVELLRLEYETFIHSAFLQQGHADAFTVKPPSQRKAILGDILGLAQWQEYETRAKERLSQIDHERGVIAYRLEEIARQEAEEPALRKDLEAAETALVDAAGLLEEAQARYDEVKGSEEQMQAAQSRLAHAQNRIRQREADLADIEAELARYAGQIQRLDGVIDERESIEAGYAELQKAREADQELGEKLQVMNEVKDRLGAVNERLGEARAELEAKASVHQDRIATAERQAAELNDLRADLADVQADVAHLEGEQQRRDDLRDEIAALEAETAELKGVNRGLYDEMQVIKSRIDQLQAAEATCPLCGQALGEEHKAELLADFQAQGTARGDSHRANQARMAEIEVIIEEHRAAIKTIETDLRRLDGLRQRVAALGSNVELAQSASDTLHTERAALHSVTEMLESGQYAHELQAQRTTIQQEIEGLGYDSDAHTAARESLSTFHEFESRQRDLSAALQQLPEVEEAHTNAQARQERWRKALDEEYQEVAAAQTEIAGLEELVAEARRREDEVRRRRTEERRAHETKVRAEQALASVESARQRKSELQRREADLNTQKAIFEDLRAAFGKNGIPAMIIEAAIPELEEAANHLLARMTGGRMHVRLDTQREKRTGGVAETLDILISDELGTRSYESYSGGEAFRVNFAIRVALSQMLARRAGAQLRTLFMDEGFGTQDELGRQRLVEAITAIQDHFDLVLVITHVEELRDAFPVQIQVNKTPDGSRITVN